MKKGWIRLYRKIQDSDIWVSGNEPFDRRSAWIDLLLMANHEDKTMLFDYNQIVVKRGQILTSVRELGSRWKWGKDRVLKYLRMLESIKMVTKDSNNKRTLLTIEKYDDFQCLQDTDEDTGKDTEQTQVRTQNRHGSATNKNIKNEKNEKKEKNIRNIIPPSVEMVREYCESRNNSVDPETFCDFYTSKDWYIGKDKMKDWQASVRTWEKDNRGRKVQSSKTPADPKDNTKIHNFKEREYDYDELMKSITQ